MRSSRRSASAAWLALALLTAPVPAASAAAVAAASMAPRRAADLVPMARRLLTGGSTLRALGRLSRSALAFVDEHGRATPELARALTQIDDRLAGAFDTQATRRFQRLLARVGVKTTRPILVPEDRTPYWLLGKQPLAGYRSSAELPAEADVVIVGAGLTGAATAYHLAEAARRGLKVVVLEAGDPANQASGRNGGNFELFPENFFAVYSGMENERYQYLKHVYPGVHEEKLRSEARRQAEAIMRFTSRNRARFVDIIEREKLDVDFSPRGWLRVAQSKTEEDGIIAESALARSLGLDVHIWSAARIRAEKGVPASYKGRFTQDGNYHPFKYVNGLLEKALAKGVQLYTRTPVRRLRTTATGEHVLDVEGGTIRARKVVFATNAFTKEVLPELENIEAYQSQIMVTEHAPVTYQGLITMKQGDLYAHYRDDENRYRDAKLARATEGRITERAPFLQGGGLDRPFKDPHRPRISRKVHETMLADRDLVAPGLKGQPPVRAWSGPMAFTRDRLPAVGELRPGLIVAAGFNGYGGSYTTAAGEAAAHMATTGAAPGWVPEDVFSPKRLITDEPLFR